MFTQTIEKTDLASWESYQLIQEEGLSSLVIASQLLAGSRILRSRYEQVVFSDCVFYACDFQGVSFENCVFENCSFEFTHLKKCNFKNCNFTNCNWTASSSINSTYEDCHFEPEHRAYLESSSNRLHFRPSDETTDIYLELALAA